jgi:RES domain-containing protein
MSRYHLGRFNTDEIGAVYASREPTTAVEELRRRASRDGTSLTAMHPRSLFVLELRLYAVVDLTVADGD